MYFFFVEPFFFSRAVFCMCPFSTLVFFFSPFFSKGVSVYFLITNSVILLILRRFRAMFFIKIYMPLHGLFFFFEIAFFFSKGGFLVRPFFALGLFFSP